MSSKKDKFKKQFQTNKVNTVQKSDKRYNKKTSKSDKEYISGNYVSSIDKKIYGIKKNLAEGKKVNGYGDDYIDTKGMKRSRYIKKQNGENPYEAKYAYQTGKPKYVKGGTRADGTKYDGFYSNKRLLKDYEKESYKNTGTLNNKEYMPKQKYALMSSHKWDNAEKFSDHLNTKVWDGIETAKANQRKGKHINNAIEVLKGGAKDVILDPAMDFVKTLGAVGGYTVSGIAGLKTDLDNSISALTDTKRTLKDYTGGKSAFVENIKDNKKTLDKTGFGLDFAHYFKKDKERADKLIEQEFKDKGKTDELNNFKKFNKDNEKLIQNSLNIAGFVSDIIMPSPIEDKVVDVVKGLGKNTVKSFKELKNGTANLATGIVPEETAKLMANSKKYAGKGNKITGASDDVFYSNKKGKSATDKLLDDDYKKTLLKEELKENKNTSKISRFLSKIDTKNVSRYSNEMDKVSDIASDVIKNKKNTTINSGSKYKPVSSNHINDDIKNVIKDPELKKYGYDKGNRYYDDYDAEFFKEVDHWQNILDKDPDNRLKNIERMKKYNKEVYDYMQQSVDDSIGSFDAEKFLSDLKKKNEVPQNVSKSLKPTYSKEHHKDNKYWVGLGEEVNNTFDASIKDIENINKTYNKFNKNVIEAKINNTELTKIPGKIKEGRKSLNSKVDRKSIKNIVNHDNVNTEIAIEKLVNIMEGSTPKTIANNSARKFEFGKDVSSLSQNILNGNFDIDNFKKIKDTIVGTNATKAQKIDYINNTLFGGKKVLTRSATKNSIDDFLNSIDEINEVKKVIDNFYETGEYLPISLSKSTREFLGIPNNKQLKITDKKFAGKNIDNPEDIVIELTNALINKSGSLTDARYWEKQQLLANKYGYKKVQYVKDELDEITKTLKSLDKKQTTPSVLAQKQELSMRRKQLKELLDNRQQDWDGILKSMNEVTFDDYIAKEYPDIMNKIDFYKQKNTNPNSFNVEKISNQSNVNRVFDELLGETADANKGKRMNYADFVKEQYETMTLKDKALNNKQWQDELKRRWKEYNLELDGAVDERNIEYLRGEKMRNQIRDGASSVKNNNVGQNSRARQEMLDEVGEHVAPKYTTQELHKMKYDQKILNHQIDNIRKTYDLPKPKVNAKIKLQKGQKLKDLPPVKENLANLRKTIQKEIKYMFENPDKYKEFEGAFKQVKLDYVNSLRSIGVPDDKYFHKVVALQDELKGKMNEILKGGTKNTPLLKMELQKLASRVDETFKGFDDVVLDKIDDVNIKTFDDVVTDLNKADNPFDEFLKQKQNTSSQFNNTKIGEQTNIFDMFDNKDFQPNEDYVHLPDLLKEQNNFPVNGDFDVLDLLKPNVDKDSQIDMLGYITGQKIDVDKKSLYKSKKKRKFNTVDELDDTSFSLPKIPNQLDSGSFKQFADKLYELGINPYQKPPKTKPNNMPKEVYEYWSEFSNKVLSDDVSKKGINELKAIDEHISKNSKELAKPTKTTPDKSLENLNVYEDSMKNSTKTIHKNIDEYNKLNKYVDDVNIDNYMGATNKMSSETAPTFEQFKEALPNKIPKHKDNELYDMYKRWLNSYKKGLTVYNPGWHVQNFFQNKGQNYLALGADALLPQTEARNILKQINGKGSKNGVIKNVKTNQAYSYDEIGKLAQELGVVDGLGEDVRNARGIFPRLEKQIDNLPIMKWLETNEQTARLNHFIKQIERGMSPEDASKSVNKYLFDYSKKNKFDDFMGDVVDPFWTFHKNNARLMYGSMFEHPGKINSIIRGTKGLENGIPEEQRQNEEFKYGKIQKPYANFTDSVNGDQYNYLYKQNMFPDVEDAIPFEDEALENKMNPLVRMLIQQSRGEGNFGNKIVEEGEEPGWNEITKEERVKEVLMDLNPFMPNAVKTMDKILERQQKAEDGKQSKETSDKQAFMDFINYITGNKGNWYRNLDL